jgi:hypothetical protein
MAVAVAQDEVPWTRVISFDIFVSSSSQQLAKGW